MREGEREGERGRERKIKVFVIFLIFENKIIAKFVTSK